MLPCILLTANSHLWEGELDMSSSFLSILFGHVINKDTQGCNGEPCCSDSRRNLGNLAKEMQCGLYLLQTMRFFKIITSIRVNNILYQTNKMKRW